MAGQPIAGEAVYPPTCAQPSPRPVRRLGLLGCRAIVVTRQTTCPVLPAPPQASACGTTIDYPVAGGSTATDCVGLLCFSVPILPRDSHPGSLPEMGRAFWVRTVRMPAQTETMRAALLGVEGYAILVTADLRCPVGHSAPRSGESPARGWGIEWAARKDVQSCRGAGRLAGPNKAPQPESSPVGSNPTAPTTSKFRNIFHFYR